MAVTITILVAVRDLLDLAVSLCGSVITDDEGRRTYVVFSRA